MFNAINKNIASAVETIQSYTASFKQRISNGLSNVYSYIQQLLTSKKPESGSISASPISTAQFAASSLPQKDLLLSPQAQGNVSTLPTSDSAPSVSSIAQEGKFPTYGRAYFRQSPAVPTDEQARLLQSSRYKAVFSKFTGSEAIRQRSVEVSEKLNTRYLLKYSLSSPTAAADQANSRGILKMTQADKDLNILRRSLEQKIDALVEEFQEVAHKVSEGTATPQERHTFDFFIEQQNRLLTQFEKDLATKSKGWES
jgi:hypothetical protein